jgi:glyoxylase-like metal-dependent hydrolase (beta-lactamase superfamily II)
MLSGRAVLAGLVILVAAPEGAQTPATSGLRSYFEARAVLDAGIEAIGGLSALSSAKTVRRQMSGDWIGSGQHPRPYPTAAPTMTVPPSNGRTRTVSFIDYAGTRFLDEAVESDFAGDFITRVTAVTESTGFETLIYGDEKPFFRAYSEEDVRSIRLRKFRRYPEGVLQMALGRPETLQWVGRVEEDGRALEAISFSDSMGVRVVLYFDSETRLLTKSETLREHAIAGDSSSEIFYLDYRPVGPLKLPFQVIDRTAGVPVEEMRASVTELNLPLPDEGFHPPRVFARVENDPARPEISKLGEGLYLIRGPYNVLFAAFRDHVAVFEAPLNSRYAETCLELIRKTLPDRPIRYVVATHFHYDHVAGLRPYIAGGVPIVTTPDAKGVIERVASSPRGMYPDALSRRPVEPRIETVTGAKAIDDGTNRVELYDIGPTEHVAQLLVAYFPRQKVLFEADVWDPISLELDVAGTDAATLARKMRELGLEVERIIPVHGVPTTMAALERGLSVRAKYSR